jgi:uncharacterized membrane protein
MNRMSNVNSLTPDEFPGRMDTEPALRQAPHVSDRAARVILAIDRTVLNISRHWLLYTNLFLGVLVLAPLAAPVLMAVGATGPAEFIYLIYGLICHQLPQRSYFLFGPQISYSLAEIGRVWNYDGMFALRAFVGNSAMGWKVAWSDRMISLYGGLWVAGLLYGVLRGRLPRLSPYVWLVVGVLPLAVDGFSHVVNDALAGFTGTGFRDTNAWLQFLTGSVLPAGFYAGDALGSFNSLMRLITGFLFAVLSIWFLYPSIDRSMTDLKRQASARLSSPRALRLGLSAAGQPLTESPMIGSRIKNRGN